MRQLRALTYSRARTFLPLPSDEGGRSARGAAPAAARDQQRKAGGTDVIIAATALRSLLTNWTQDSNFPVLQESQPALQVERG